MYLYLSEDIELYRRRIEHIINFIEAPYEIRFNVLQTNEHHPLGEFEERSNEIIVYLCDSLKYPFTLPLSTKKAPIIQVFNWEEYVLVIMSHELAHYYQSKQNKRYNEYWADRKALSMLTKFRHESNRPGDG